MDFLKNEAKNLRRSYFALVFFRALFGGKQTMLFLQNYLENFNCCNYFVVTTNKLWKFQ